MPITILLAEEDLVKLDKFGTALSELRFNVLLAYKVKDAVESLINNNVDLMVTNINIPEQGGLHLIQYMRKMMKYRKLPVVLLSDNQEDENTKKAIEIGVAASLPGDIEADKLKAIILGIFNKSVEKSGDTPKAAVLESLRRITVLLTDADQQVTKDLSDFLTPFFKKVFTSGSVEGARNICRDESIDILISAVKMPEESGFDLVKWCNGFPDTSGIPVILITGSSQDMESIKIAKSLNIERYLVKPVDTKKLLSGIMEISTDSYRRNKMTKFINHYDSIDKNLDTNEQEKLKTVRTQMIELNSAKDNLNKQIRMKQNMPGVADTKELEELLELLEQKEKDVQELLEKTKMAYFDRHKEIINIKRGIIQRLDSLKL